MAALGRDDHRRNLHEHLEDLAKDVMNAHSYGVVCESCE